MLALLGGLLVSGLVANGQTLPEALAAINFLAAVLGIARLWQWTGRGRQSRQPLTRRQVVWQAAVFVAWLAAVAALGWWYQQNREGAAGQQPLPEEHD